MLTEVARHSEVGVTLLRQRTQLHTGKRWWGCEWVNLNMRGDQPLAHQTLSPEDSPVGRLLCVQRADLPVVSLIRCVFMKLLLCC